MPSSPRIPKMSSRRLSRTFPNLPRGCRKCSNLRLVQIIGTLGATKWLCLQLSFASVLLEHSRIPKFSRNLSDFSDFEPLAYTKSNFVTLRVFKFFVNYYFFPNLKIFISRFLRISFALKLFLLFDLFFTSS